MQTFADWLIARITEGYEDAEPPEEIQQQRLHQVSSEVMCHMGAMAAMVFSDPVAVLNAYRIMIEQGFNQGMQTKSLLANTSRELQ